ncbi:MAG: molecular chaperone TorD family protein [Planctomycetaceae bacterium]|nr:molecular chaperone TorD family protein [Planctomycetaceae bacterium]
MDNSPPRATEELRSVAPVFHLLSQIWLKEWTGDLTKTWQNAAAFTTELLDERAVDMQSADLEDLATEYCRLFIGPGEFLPLVQSVWETGQRAGASTASMQTYLERLQLDRPISTEAADHLGHIFWLFARLLEGLPDTSAGLPVLQEFFDAHLRWPAELLRRIEAANDSVYGQASRLSQLLLEAVHEHIPDSDRGDQPGEG